MHKARLVDETAQKGKRLDRDKNWSSKENPLARGPADRFPDGRRIGGTMDTVTIRAKGISVSVDLAVGHLADLAVETEGRTLRPLHRAPWLDEPAESLPPGLPDGVVRLSGDFLCAPFSAADVEPAPLHGWTANSAWDVVESGAIDGGWRARFRLQRKVMGATVEKILTLRDGHPFLYQEHGFSGGAGAISVAHHAMTVMKDGGRLSFSPKRLAATPETALEPDPARGRYLLAYPAKTADLAAFPTADGGTTDLGDYRMDRRHEDFVTLVEADHGGPGWTAVARRAERDLVLVLKNPAELPVTMLWISNGGRDYAPWNGRHRGVIGIEDGRTAIGHAASLGDNWLKREGVATAFELAEGRRVAFRQVIGATTAEGEPASEIAVAPSRLNLAFADGSVRNLAFDDTFLAGG
jgi:prepilin-type processing-associated H-X9-DG protein